MPSLFDARVNAQSVTLTPEDVSGVSIRQIDTLRQLSPDYAAQPDGKELPKSADDDWLPEMSLAPGYAQSNKTASSPAVVKSAASQPSASGNTQLSMTSAAANLNSVSALNPVSATAPHSTVNVPAANIANAPAANPAATPAVIPTTNSAVVQNAAVHPALTAYNVGFSVSQNSEYDPGFAVSGTSPNALAAQTAPIDLTSVPNPPATGGNTYLTNPAAVAPTSNPTPIPAATPMNQPAAEPVSIPAPVAPAELPLDVLQPNGAAAFPADGQTAVPSLPTETPKTDAAAAPTNDRPAVPKSPEGLLVADILCSEGLEMPISRFNKLIKTKIGSNFSQQRLEEDKRALLQTKQYVDVIVSTTLLPNEPDKVVVNFDFTPRRQMKYIKVIGNKKLSKSDILEELGMKRGESRMDPYDVENGRIRIIELYKSKEYSEPYVEILRGDRPEDMGVVYLIDEGVKQRVLKTTFTGNTVVSSARLKSLVSVKPGVLYLIGGDFSRERLDEDVTKLLEYYRNLGYFDARIDREYEEGEGYTGLGKENAWITVHFIIDEGRRYKIRNFLFEGNRVLSSDQLRGLLKVKPGDYFNQGELEGDRVKLANSYQDIGYVRAEIMPTQIFTENEGEIDVRYRIDEDYRYRIKDIVIQYEGGESRTKAAVVMNLLDFAPSQIAVGPKIRSSETNLKRSGYFNDKPNEGPLPSIAIVPEEENLYFSEVTAADGTKEKAPGADALLTEKKKSFLFLGSKETEQKAKKPVTKQKDDAADSNGSAEPAEPLPSYGGGIIRGQSHQIPTGFSNATTVSGGTTASTAGSGAWNGSSYIGYPSANTATTTVSPYADTSMYNNSVSADGSTNSVAPPLTSTAANPFDTTTANNGLPGLYSGTTTGQIDPTQPAYTASAPGFAAAGRDAVFPGTQEQQYLDDQLLGSNSLDGGDPIRNATVIAKIMEGRTGMLQASIGVNSNYGLVGNVSYTERNFDILKWPTAFWRPDGWADAFRGAGQIFRVEASPGTTLQRYSVSWDVPYIFDSKYNFGVTGLYGDRYYDDWYETRMGGDLRLGRQWTNRFSTTLTGGLYNVKIYRPTTYAIPDLNEVLGNNALYSAGLTASYDTRNHPYMPSNGYVVSGGAEQIFGTYTYTRVSYDARTYFTLHKRADGSGKKVLGLRSAAGWTGDKTPIYDRYYGGGYANLRGFEYREVTPRYPGTSFGIGGNFEFYNSAELLVPVSGGDEFQLAFFVDTGTVAKDINNWGKYRVAPGFGLRIAIPMLGPAPLALDFAFPVCKSSEDETEVFSFSIVGSR